MLKEKDLTKYGKYRYKGESFSMADVQARLQDVADEGGIPVAFRPDILKTGGLFNGSEEELLVMYHPDHPKDYFNFCINIHTQGKYTFLMVNTFGTSKQLKKESISSNNSSFVGDALEAGASYAVGAMIGGAVRLGINAIGKNKNKLAEEKEYYECIDDIIETACNG